MNQDILNWVKKSIKILLNEYSGHEGVSMLIETFVTQYELNAIRIFENRELVKKRVKRNYIKQKIKNTLLNSKYHKINFSEEINEIDMLFWPFQSIHFDSQIDLYNELTIDGGLKLGIFSHNQPTEDLIKINNLNGVISLNNKNSIWVDYKMKSFYIDLIQSARNLPSFELHGKEILFEDVLISSLNSWYWLYEYTIDIFNGIIKKYNPKSIFVGNNITLVGNIIGHLAERRGIKIFCIMHGRLNNYFEFSKFDYCYLFGNKDKIELTKQGIPSSKLIVSGSPKIDSFFKIKKSKISKKKSILIALSGPGHSITEQHHVQILDMLYDVALKFNKIQFNFKLHRKDSINYYNKFYSLSNTFISEYNDKTVSSNIYDWIYKTDILLTGASTSALDAMLMGCPVITIDLMGHLEEVDFIKENISVHTTNYEELTISISELLLKRDTFKDHLNRSKNYIQNMYTQPPEGSLSFIKKHMKSVVV